MASLNHQQQQGLSLIEMLITALLGALILLAVGTSMSAITRTQTTIQDYEQVQDTLRFTTAFMGRKLRTAQGVSDFNRTEFTLNFSENPSPPTKTERFYWDATQNQLRFQDDDTLRDVVVAYDVVRLSFRYAQYHHEEEIVFVEYDEVDIAQPIIAVEMTMDLASRALPDQNIRHTHTQTMMLRNAFTKKSQPKQGE